MHTTRRWISIHRARARHRWRVNRAFRRGWTHTLLRLERKYPLLVRAVVRKSMMDAARDKFAAVSRTMKQKSTGMLASWGKGIFRKLFGKAPAGIPKEAQPA